MFYLKQSKKQILVFIMLFLIVTLTIFLKIVPYLKNDYYYLIGFDSGKYVYDLKYKASTTLNSLDLWSEPGLNTNLTAFTSLTPIDPIIVYKYILPIFVSIFFILISYLFTKEISGSPIAGIFAAMYLSI